MMRLHVSNVNDETRHDIPDEVSELSAPETHFDPQAHTHHLVIFRCSQLECEIIKISSVLNLLFGYEKFELRKPVLRFCVLNSSAEHRISEH